MVLSDILAGAGGLIGTGYNLYANKRDFDYQKALQKQIFQREDTAVQRRVEDLKAAGLNPALALGSAAGAGSVVSRSNTNDVNFGATLDYMNAVNQIRQKKAETGILKEQEQQAQLDTKVKKYQSLYEIHKYLADMGIATMPYFENGKFNLLEPDDAYPALGTTIPLEKFESDYLNYKDTFGKILRENTELQRKMNETTTNMILGKSQISNWSLKNTLDVFQALTNKELKEKEIEIAGEKLGLDVKKMNFNQMIQSLPWLLMILGGI